MTRSYPRAFLDLLTEARRVGWPRHFWTDLAHDAAALTRAPGPFAWHLYDSGTHLIRPESRPLRELCRTIDTGFPGGRWYYHDGHRLRPLESVAEAITLLEDEIAAAARTTALHSASERA